MAVCHPGDIIMQRGKVPQDHAVMASKVFRGQPLALWHPHNVTLRIAPLQKFPSKKKKINILQISILSWPTIKLMEILYIFSTSLWVIRVKPQNSNKSFMYSVTESDLLFPHSKRSEKKLFGENEHSEMLFRQHIDAKVWKRRRLKFSP